MEEDKSLFETRAYARKDLIQQDFAIRLSETINSARMLYYSLTNAKEEADTPIEHLQATASFCREKAARSHDTKIIQEIWLKKADQYDQMVENYKETIRRRVDPDAFNAFLLDFYGLWIEGKDQISSTRWAKNPLENGEDTESALETLFNETSEGKISPRKTLVLFQAYLKSLANCGILDFKYHTFKSKEAWRQSIG